MPQTSRAAATRPRPDERVCYRYRTPALVGPWRQEADNACADAVGAGQARREECGTLKWLVDGRIEQSFCDQGGSCGGVYPAN